MKCLLKFQMKLTVGSSGKGAENHLGGFTLRRTVFPMISLMRFAILGDNHYYHRDI